MNKLSAEEFSKVLLTVFPTQTMEETFVEDLTVEEQLYWKDVATNLGELGVAQMRRLCIFMAAPDNF